MYYTYYMSCITYYILYILYMIYSILYVERNACGRAMAESP